VLSHLLTLHELGRSRSKSQRHSITHSRSEPTQITRCDIQGRNGNNSTARLLHHSSSIGKRPLRGEVTRNRLKFSGISSGSFLIGWIIERVGVYLCGLSMLKIIKSFCRSGGGFTTDDKTGEIAIVFSIPCKLIVRRAVFAAGNGNPKSPPNTLSLVYSKLACGNDRTDLASPTVYDTHGVNREYGNTQTLAGLSSSNRQLIDNFISQDCCECQILC